MGLFPALSVGIDGVEEEDKKEAILEGMQLVWGSVIRAVDSSLK